MSQSQIEMSIRLPKPQHAKLRVIAEIEGVSINDVIRRAVAAVPDPCPKPEGGRTVVD